MPLPGSDAVARAVAERASADARPRFFVHVILPVLVLVAGFVAAYAYASAQAPLPSLAQANELQAWRAEHRSAALVAVAIVALASVAAQVLFFLGAYRLVVRRNRHFARDADLRAGLIDACRELAGPRASHEATLHLTVMERMHVEAKDREKPRGAPVHLVVGLAFNPWVLFTLYTLLKDVPRHARRQMQFAKHARELLVGLRGADVPTMPALRERSFLLLGGVLAVGAGALAGAAFVASPLRLVLVGAGGAALLAAHFVWWAWAYMDPGQHLDAQAAFEDAVVPVLEAAAAVSPVAAPAPAAAPRASIGPAPAKGPNPAPALTAGAAPPPAAASDVWACPKCGKKYKVPPKRPVKVTCKACGHNEILRA